jgi:hypothetical protein
MRSRCTRVRARLVPDFLNPSELPRRFFTNKPDRRPDARMAEDKGELAMVPVDTGTHFGTAPGDRSPRVNSGKGHWVALMRLGRDCEQCRLTAIANPSRAIQTGPEVDGFPFNKRGGDRVGGPRVRRRAAAMRWAIVAACLLVSSCRGDRAQDIDACWVEAIKGHPSEPVDAPNVLATIPGCMRTRGYDSQVSSEFCPASNQATTVLNPDCYRPRGIVRRTLYTAEFLLRHLHL